MAGVYDPSLTNEPEHKKPQTRVLALHTAPERLYLSVGDLHVARYGSADPAAPNGDTPRKKQWPLVTYEPAGKSTGGRRVSGGRCMEQGPGGAQTYRFALPVYSDHRASAAS